MEPSIATSIPKRHRGTGGDNFTLSQFLSLTVSDGSCFCCGSSTELMLDGSGLIFARCSSCGAEISTMPTAGETACSENSLPVLQAA